MNRTQSYEWLLSTLWENYKVQIIDKITIFEIYHDEFNEPLDVERFLLHVEEDPCGFFVVERLEGQKYRFTKII